MSDSDGFDDDDFGDFEEGEMTQIEVPKVRNSKPIDDILAEILPKVELEDNQDNYRTEFTFDERSDKLLDNLLNTEEYPMQKMIWKQSMILKQLFLNLDIPIVEDSFLKRKNHINMDLDYNLKVDENIQLVIPDFDKLGISEEEFKQILANTNDQISQISITNKDYKDLDEGQIDEEIIKMGELKQSLLKTLSAWNKQYDIIKSDNDLFTSYIDNLVGNTQKLRRKNK